MNKLYTYIFPGLLSLLLFSCYKDNSTLGNKPITVLSITLQGIQGDVINMEKNQQLKIDPTIAQDGKKEKITYQWDVNYETFSTEKVLIYPCQELGTFHIRLKATNKDGSAFKTITLNVNSPYEEGLMVLGEDEEGEGTLGFLRILSTGEKDAGMEEHFVNDVFRLNNPGEKIGKRPTDIIKRLNQIYISSSAAQKIYFLNDKTFELEATVTAPDLPGFKPVAMNIPDAGFRTASILCEDGKIYNLALLEYLVMANNSYVQHVIEKTDFGYDYNDCYSYFWDDTNDQLLMYSSYYSFNSENTFSGQDLLTFFYDSDASYVYVITKNTSGPVVYTKTIFPHYLNSFNLNTYTWSLDILQQTTLNVSGTPALTPQSPALVITAYKKYIYASGNKVYSWFYTGNSMSSTPFITIEKGTITALEQSPDGEKLYIGAYDPAEKGLKGSVYVYSVDNGKLIRKFENVVDKPVKLFYKKKN